MLTTQLFVIINNLWPPFLWWKFSSFYRSSTSLVSTLHTTQLIDSTFFFCYSTQSKTKGYKHKREKGNYSDGKLVFKSCTFQYKPYGWHKANVLMVQHKTVLCSRREEKNLCPACHMQLCELPLHYNKYHCHRSKILPVKLKPDEASTQSQLGKSRAPQGVTHTHSNSLCLASKGTEAWAFPLTCEW